MMRNRRAICLGVLCVLFMTSTVFAQSQSATDTIIEKIGESERRVRDHVDKKIEGVETKISAVNTKVETVSTQVGTLRTDVAVNKTNIGNIKESIRDLKGTVDRIWYGILGILGTLILSIGGYFLKSRLQNQGKKDDVDAVDRLAEQITRLASAQTEILDQITRLISAQARTSETKDVFGDPKVPDTEGLDESADDLRFTHHDTGERI